MGLAGTDFQIIKIIKVKDIQKKVNNTHEQIGVLEQKDGNCKSKNGNAENINMPSKMKNFFDGLMSRF